MKKTGMIFVLILLVLSCNKNDDNGPVIAGSDLVGTWYLQQYNMLTANITNGSNVQDTTYLYTAQNREELTFNADFTYSYIDKSQTPPLQQQSTYIVSNDTFYLNSFVSPSALWKYNVSNAKLVIKEIYRIGNYQTTNTKTFQKQ